ncbi:MAG: hypothetical protein M3451_12030 [Chloroflexota bacterium]|nr:hypothetical protein [Chloroflexota bacterium]
MGGTNENLCATFALVSLVFANTAQAGHPGNLALHLPDDVVRDGRADIIFRGNTALAYWTMGPNGQVVSSNYAGDAGPGYTVGAVD